MNRSAADAVDNVAEVATDSSDAATASLVPSQSLPAPPPTHRRTLSGAGLLSKLPFVRSLSDGKPRQEIDGDASRAAPTSMSTITQQQQKSRKRKGSLRKVALLGRGAQRERREAKQLTIDTSHSIAHDVGSAMSRSHATLDHDPLGLNIADLTPRPSMEGYASRPNLVDPSVLSRSPPNLNDTESAITSPTISYTSTTDEDDVLHIPNHTSSPLRPDLSLSSGSDSYFANRARRRSILHAKSPLSYSGLSSTPLPPSDAEWDYSETEWWGWVVLVVTWIVFVVGMGSCFGIWSWAWDVGTTPYAPPELEDDPTLPIVGYYPALIILTCIMAWVWVVVAWVGMKYFRHAKISGD
ncbi:hypothetical protein CCHL11_09446 [Colletotrichum chlorophyti]|uniref:Uncharacterized protein n=1 Tax=Colletotrichum chlorophyti TaxID=708187 RepID=A0A1Q8S1X0_9PEZI|nr:hypothetical protein CCHL11_09446 [Colletotrichum chlorophyti]